MMRYILAMSMLAAAAIPVLADDAPKKKAVQPIEVVDLKRTDAVLYEKEIEPILVKKCQVCHSGGVKESRLDLGTYEAMMRGGRRGPNVMPGKSADSLLVKLSGKTMGPKMPPKDHEPLTPQELALIKLWIDQGAKAPTGMKQRPQVVVAVPPSTIQPIRALAISPDKATVAVARSNQVTLYEAKSGNVLQTLVDAELKTSGGQPVQAAHLAIVESLAFSPDGKLLATGSFRDVKLWNPADGSLKTRIPGFADRVMALAFSPDGKLLATGGGAATEDGEIKVLEVPEGKQVLDIKNGHSDTVFGVAFSPDGTKLATCSADKFVKVFEMPSGKFVKALEGHTHHVLDVAWKHDGKLLASAGADNLIKIWDLASGEQKRNIKGHNKQVTRLQFVGKTSQLVTCGGDQNVLLFNTDNGGRQRAFTGAKDFLYALAVTADGSLVAAGGEEGVARLYDGRNGKLLKTLAPGKPVPDKK